jgi:shikimate kinase
VARVVVLLGAPGSGKSTLGEALGRRGLRWRDREPEILARWGSRAAFAAAKAEALPALHADIRAWVAEGGAPAVVESTGLSDAPLLDTLARDHECLVVRLDVSAEGAAARVAGREAGRHLSDDAGANRAVWHAFQDVVVPSRAADLVVDTEALAPDAVADAVWRSFVAESDTNERQNEITR